MTLRVTPMKSGAKDSVFRPLILPLCLHLVSMSLMAIIFINHHRTNSLSLHTLLQILVLKYLSFSLKVSEGGEIYVLKIGFQILVSPLVTSFTHVASPKTTSPPLAFLRVKQSRTLWSSPPLPPCPLPAFCLWKTSVEK